MLKTKIADISDDLIARRLQKKDLLQILGEATVPKVKEDIRKLLRELENSIIIP